MGGRGRGKGGGGGGGRGEEREGEGEGEGEMYTIPSDCVEFTNVENHISNSS